jgi:hypothetical protein
MTYFLRERERAVRYSSRVEEKERHGRIEKYFYLGVEKEHKFLEGSQSLPTHSDRTGIRMVKRKWLEIQATEFWFTAQG